MKYLAYVSIIFPIIGFFVSPETMNLDDVSSGKFYAPLAIWVFTLPWYGKLISILIGVFYLKFKYNREGTIF